MTAAPNYLIDYEELYNESPRQAALSWFKEAKYGLFMHYGLYSLLGRHEWVQLIEKIPVAEYAKLADKFTAEKFDAKVIADFAVNCGMKYVNLTTRHHDSFCLFNTKETDFNSVNCPAKRDLVAELAEACDSCGLGLCLYYSHGRDWWHPHAPNNDEWGGSARPEYDPPEPSYAYGEDHDLQKYLDYMSAQITELLTNYGPIASIWLDGIGVPLNGDASKFKAQELYDMIHGLQPQVLVSCKQGLLGTEDFFAPEHSRPTGDDEANRRGAISDQSSKIVEICTTMTEKGWGYMADQTIKRKNADDVWATLKNAAENDANLLLNTGPLPDGSLDPRDVEVLLQVGERIRENGLPEK